MGKRHRKTRSICKRLLLQQGLRETELGEIRTTKAAARRQYLLVVATRLWAEADIVRAAHDVAVKDMLALEDALFNRTLEDALAVLASEEHPQETT